MQLITRQKLGLLFLFITIPVTAVMAQNVFNGKMVMKWENGLMSKETFYSQNGLIRVDMTYASGIRFYKIFKNKILYTIYPSSKRCIYGSLKNITKAESSNGNRSHSQSSSDKSSYIANLKALWKKSLSGKTKKILGHTCYEHVLPSGDGGSTHLWVARDIAVDSHAHTILITPNVAFNFDKLGNYFPFLLEDIGKDGKVTPKFEVISIEKEQLDKSIFEVPKNYTKMKIPNVH